MIVSVTCFCYQFILIQLVFLLTPLFHRMRPSISGNFYSLFSLSSQSLPSSPSSFAINSPSLHHHSQSVCLSTITVSAPGCTVIILPPIHLFLLACSFLLSFYPPSHISPSIHRSVSFSQVAEQISG